MIFLHLFFIFIVFPLVPNAFSVIGREHDDFDIPYIAPRNFVSTTINPSTTTTITSVIQTTIPTESKTAESNPDTNNATVNNSINSTPLPIPSTDQSNILTVTMEPVLEKQRASQEVIIIVCLLSIFGIFLYLASFFYLAKNLPKLQKCVSLLHNSDIEV